MSAGPLIHIRGTMLDAVAVARWGAVSQSVHRQGIESVLPASGFCAQWWKARTCWLPTPTVCSQGLQEAHIDRRHGCCTGFSDPFVKLKYNEVKQKTQVFEKTLNPVWNSDFTLYGCPIVR